MDSTSEESQERRPDPDASPQTTKQVIRQVKRYRGRRVSAEARAYHPRQGPSLTEGVRGEETVRELCPWEGIQKVTYYKWLKSLLGAGKRRRPVKV